jgi:hypothetical protein
MPNPSVITQACSACAFTTDGAGQPELHEHREDRVFQNLCGWVAFALCAGLLAGAEARQRPGSLPNPFDDQGFAFGRTRAGLGSQPSVNGQNKGPNWFGAVVLSVMVLRKPPRNQPFVVKVLSGTGTIESGESGTDQCGAFRLIQLHRWRKNWLNCSWPVFQGPGVSQLSVRNVTDVLVPKIA